MAAPPARNSPSKRRGIVVASGAPHLPLGQDMDHHPFPALQYERFPGKLFVGRISPRDVGQGDLGDCFFLSALVAVANTSPALIRRAIRKHRDGTWTVTFNERTRRGTVCPVAITVDARFPATRRGAQVFGKGLEDDRHGQELWPALFEKAFAQWKGGYDVIDKGGYGREALEALTGKKVSQRSLGRMTSAELWRLLKGAKAAKAPVVTSTPGRKELKRRTGRSNAGGLIEDHVYAVLDSFEHGGERYVRLYSALVDATDVRVGTPDRKDDALRTVVLPLGQYRRAFADVSIGGPR